MNSPFCLSTLIVAIFLSSFSMRGAQALLSLDQRLKLLVYRNQINKDFLAACSRGNCAEAQTLLHSRAHVNATTAAGDSALHIAATTRNTGLMALLLDAKCDVDARGFGGLTPLHDAAYYGPVEAIKILCDARARTDIFSEDGRTALHDAVCCASSDCAQAIALLHSRGASLDAAGVKKGDTPLHRAVAGGKVTAVTALCELGADAARCNSAGLNPLDVAYQLPDNHIRHSIITLLSWHIRQSTALLPEEVENARPVQEQVVDGVLIPPAFEEYLVSESMLDYMPEPSAPPLSDIALSGMAASAPWSMVAQEISNG